MGALRKEIAERSSRGRRRAADLQYSVPRRYSEFMCILNHESGPYQRKLVVSPAINQIVHSLPARLMRVDIWCYYLPLRFHPLDSSTLATVAIVLM